MNRANDGRDLFLESSGANLYFLDSITHLLGDQKVGQFLDIGCGTGILAECLQEVTGLKGYGTELSASACEIASRRISCVSVSDERLPFAPDFFRLVLAKDVLPMIRDKARWYREIYRVLAPGGLFITYLPTDSDYREKLLYAAIPGSEAASRTAYGSLETNLSEIRAAGFVDIVARRLPLGTVRVDSGYAKKHGSGFFSNTTSEQYSSGRDAGIWELGEELRDLSLAGIKVHYEWERTLIEGVKGGVR